MSSRVALIKEIPASHKLRGERSEGIFLGRLARTQVSEDISALASRRVTLSLEAGAKVAITIQMVQMI